MEGADSIMNIRLTRLFQLRHPLVALFLILVLLGLHSFTSTNHPSATVLQQKMSTISITQAGFLPNQLTKRVGEKITLMVVNQDTRPHNFTIEELHVHSATLKPGESTSLILENTLHKGVYSFISNPSGIPETGYLGQLSIE